MTEDKTYDQIHAGHEAKQFLDQLELYRAEIERDLFDRFKKTTDQEDWPALHRLLIGVQSFQLWAQARVENGKYAQRLLDEQISKG